MTVDILARELEIMLKALRVSYKRVKVPRSDGQHFICSSFGLIASVVEHADVEYTRTTLGNRFVGYRYYIMAGMTDVRKARMDLIWALAEGGYLRYIRVNFPSQFADLITMQDFGRQIIDERLARWRNAPKYKFLIEENEKAKKFPMSMILSMEPGFFDYMPEKQGGTYYVF